MNSRDSLALLAGLGQGYMHQEDVERDRKLQQADIDWRNNLRERDQAQYDAAQKQKADLVAASADVTPSPDAGTASPGVDPSANAPSMQGSGFGGAGNDPSAQPAPVASTYSVGGQSGMSQADATAAAAKLNTPTAQMARMSAALRANGDPVAAAQLDAQARQAQLGDIQLSAAQKQKHQEDFNDHLLSVLPGGHGAIAKFISESDGDGKGGALQAKAVPSADGKSVTYQFTQPDGSVTNGPTFSNDKQGATEAAFLLQKGMTPDMLVKHNEALTKDKREQQQVDQQGKYQEGMLSLERTKVALERAKVGAATTKDPVLQMKMGIIAKNLEATTTQRLKIEADPEFDPTKPPKGYSTLRSGEAALQQQLLDLTAGKGAAAPTGRDPIALVDAASRPPAPVHPLSPAAAAVDAAPPGSWSQAGVTPSAQPVATMSPRTARDAAITGASNDPDVRKLNAAIDAAPSGRAAIGLKVQRDALLQQRYGL